MNLPSIEEVLRAGGLTFVGYITKGGDHVMHTRVSVGKAAHRCEDCVECAGGLVTCVLARPEKARPGQLYRGADGGWTR
jgi:hypothetical protein